jgi:hypothetical protein
MSARYAPRGQVSGPSRELASVRSCTRLCTLAQLTQAYGWAVYATYNIPRYGSTTPANILKNILNFFDSGFCLAAERLRAIADARGNLRQRLISHSAQSSPAQAVPSRAARPARGASPPDLPAPQRLGRQRDARISRGGLRLGRRRSRKHLRPACTSHLGQTPRQWHRFLWYFQASFSLLGQSCVRS